MALQRRLRLTFMIVTHDQDEAMVVADRMAVMREGEVVQVGPPREVYERPVNRYVAGFIGEVNLFATGAKWVAVRPERLSLHAQPTDGALPGRVTEVAYFGDRTRYVVATEVGQDVRVSLVGAPIHALGDAVWVGQPRGAGVEVAE
jgi:ABC-type Fe3+/spermidine/putrescine transport system ATPase subunit